MKKIALIEDRYKRQDYFLTQTNIDLIEYEDILVNFIEEKALNLLENIINNNIDLIDFDIIICHKSVKNNTIILSNLQNFCKKHDKILVLFSGGISVNYYDNNEFELLELNSKTFYSENLKFFLEAVKNKNENILMLCYGNNWEINVVSNILEKTNYLIEQIEESIVFYNEFADFVDIYKLSKINHSFYDLKIYNNKTTKEEIKFFRESLINFYNKSREVKKTPNQNVLIHFDNVVDSEFEINIKFNCNDDIDKYISNYIIKKLQNKEFDRIFIKDNLSSNYLEFYGLRVAYHLRLSSELEDKRFVPIIIISDFDEGTLNRFNSDAKFLFTEGVYLCKNIKDDIKKYQSLELEKLLNYNNFLSSIQMVVSKDISGNHDISNMWSIYIWAYFLDVKSKDIENNNIEIENQLYFKYLKAKNTKKNIEKIEIRKPSKNGKILLIDDEWNKGWSDILAKAFNKDGIDFTSFEYDFKDKTRFNLYMQTHKKVKDYMPDVVLLDLRLAQSDHDNENIDSYTGIKILEKIHEINAGIQVIMLTATSKSTILAKLYEKNILGYIKKEHPEDKEIDTVETINKLINLIDNGLKRKYLKEIWNIQREIHHILSQDIFNQYKGLEFDSYEQFWIKLEREAINIFDILNGESKNKFIYAMISIASSLETIISIFINENRYAEDQFWDGEDLNCEYKNFRCRLNSLIKKLGYELDDLDMIKLITKRNSYLHSRVDVNVNEHEIVSWFRKLLKIIQIIQNPPNLKSLQ